jgi:hypothetical protein
MTLGPHLVAMIRDRVPVMVGVRENQWTSLLQHADTITRSREAAQGKTLNPTPYTRSREAAQGKTLNPTPYNRSREAAQGKTQEPPMRKGLKLASS